MRNRNSINSKLEKLDHVLINLLRIVNTQEPIETYKFNISKAQEVLEDLRTMIEREPMSHTEQNGAIR